MAPPGDSDDDQEVDSPAQSRGRREKSKKSQSRSSALERLKAAKSGNREAKYACAKEEDAVYDYVDEDEYSTRVRKRQQDDWIVDDDGMGYAETGFEIFDEEGDEENIDAKNSKKDGKKGGKDAKKNATSDVKTKNPDIKDPNKPDKKPTSLKAMFSAQAAASKKTATKEPVTEDSVLRDIMAELKQEPVLLSSAKPAAISGRSMENKASNPFSVRGSSPVPPVAAVKPAAPKPAVQKPPIAPTMEEKLSPSPEHASAVAGVNVKRDVSAASLASIPSVGSCQTAPAQSKTSKSFTDACSSASTKSASSVSVASAPSVGGILKTKLSKSSTSASVLVDEAMEMALLDEDDMEEDPFEEEMRPAVKQEADVKKEVVGVKPESKPVVSKLAPSLTQITETGWDAEEGDISCSAVPVSTSSSATSSSSLPLVDIDGESVFRFYWLDAYEDAYKQPGTIYLFGKVATSTSTFVSACVVVKDVERLVYFLPRRHRCDPKSGKRLHADGEEEDEVGFMDVYAEVNKLAGQREILKFKSKKVEKKYAFGTVTSAPHEGEYLQVMYSAKFAAFPADIKGETFSHVFGANTSFLENFLIQRKIKGPCWLDVKGAVSSSPKVSWCQVEASCASPVDVGVSRGDSLPPPPPLVVMSLSLRTVQSTKTNQNEVVLITALVNHNFRFDKPAPIKKWETHVAGISKPSDEIFPFDFAEAVAKSRNRFSCDIVANERGLLGLFLAKICKIDPDILVGHDLLGLDFDILLSRISANKVPLWSRLGRLRRTAMPKLGLGFGGKVNADAKLAAAGRLVVDTEISAKELIRCKSYDLSTLVNTVLKPPADRRHSRLDEDAIRGAYQSSANLVKLIEMTLTDANYVLALMFELNVVPLAHQITAICGNTMSKTLSGGRAERNTFLLLHAFNEKGFLCPDKEFGGKKKSGTGSAKGVAAAAIVDGEDADATAGGPSSSSKSAASRKKPQYAGGLVLEPKRGFYDKFVLLLDFNSLYPSIIQEYNICFTTINLKEHSHLKQRLTDESEGDALPPIPDGSLEAGVLPTEIRRLVESRRAVKQLLKTVEPGTDAYCQYDIRQKALKLTANSMYGCLGFAESRFHAKPLAALVTAKGRETLMKTKELALSMGLDVIYGDTDSIMINTNSTDIETVFKLGQRVKAEVNKLYKLLEIDIDGIFKSMLLLKKKKYAALTMSKGMNGEWMTTEELKGLDIVRRDWCDLAKSIGHAAVSEILSGKTREEIVTSIHDGLSALEERVRLDQEPLESYVIQKQLVKHPEEYPDKKSLPHVQVAMRNNSRGGKKCKAGDTVPYVICLDGSNSSMAQRAYHPEDLVKMDNLKVDKSYYMTSQVHPVVSRLCDPIEGLDAAVIAAALGLNPNDYVKRNKEEQTEEEAMMAGDTFQEALARFKDCDRFKFCCRRCGKEQIWDGVFFDTDGKSATATLAKCGNSECGANFLDSIGAIKNRLTLDVRTHLKNYYANWLRCDDDACGFRTRRTPLAAVKGGAPRCPLCRVGALQPEVAASKLHDQLLFYRFIFDWEKGLLGLNPAEKDAASRGGLNVVDHYATLKGHVDKVLADSAYDRVDLSQFVRMWC